MNRFKAVLQYRASTGFRGQLAKLAPDWLDLVVVDETEKATFAREMQDAGALLHVLEPVTRRVIEAAPKLKLVQKIGVGVNTIDLVAAQERGVRVANMPGTNSQAVAEFALLLMLEALRRVREFHAATRAGNGWRFPPDAFDRLGEIAGSTVGLAGYGETAKRIAPALAALGARVLYTARSARPGAPGTFVDLDTLLGESDIVSVHLPHGAETDRLFDAARFARMKKGALFVNVARGGLVDEGALVAALRSGHLGGAALDVFALEPTPADNPLLAMDNVVVAPHVAWLTPQTLGRSIGIAFENCRRIRSGEPLLHPVA